MKNFIKRYSIDDYVKRGQLSIEKAEKIEQAIRDRKNIIISGGTRSGKTTFTDAVIKQMLEYTPDDFFYILTVFESLQCFPKYAAFAECVENDEVLCSLKIALQSNPDRIILDEIRDGKVLKTLLEGWNTYSGGVATIHAMSAEETILRMKNLLIQAYGIEQPVNNLVVVHLSKNSETEICVDEVIETDDFSD